MKFNITIKNLIIAATVVASQCPAIAEIKHKPEELTAEIHRATIPTKQISNVGTFMSRQLKSFPKLKGAKAEIIDNYIIKYTIDASNLFAPNEFNLLNRATEFLGPVLPFLRQNGKYTVVAVMHTDDTGSEEYRDILCENRLLSVSEFFDTKLGAKSALVRFSLSDIQPLSPNNSFKNRAKNRRLEIYIAPGPTFLNDFKPKK